MATEDLEEEINLFFKTPGGTVVIVLIILIILGLISFFISYGTNTNILELLYNFLQYVKENVINNIAIFAIFIYLIVISFFLTDNPKIDSPLFYGLLIIGPLLVSIFYSFSGNIFESFTNILATAKENFSGTTILKALAAIAVLYGLSQLSFSSFGVQTLAYGGIIIGTLIGIVALAIAAKINRARIYNMTGLSGFIVNFLFFIPCLLSDFVEYMYGDFATTPKVVYILFVFEIILILLYLYLPKLLTKIAEREGNIIIDKPIRINYNNDATNYIDMQTSKESVALYKDNIITRTAINVRDKFTISMWVYVVPMPPNHTPYNTDANIFNFNNHPQITYNGTDKRFSIYYSNNETDIFDAPLEKWNHILVSYTRDTADFFLNGVLAQTHKRVRTDESFSVGDILTTGQENGLQGGIARVVYYERSLLHYEVGRAYNYEKGLVGYE
jgi:hypothetical protein